ncbi:MAG: Spo0E family sporulation regulatory protein-aspartic acid phosphatase [Romboutsia timonensis]|nr:Spo0E family sporulation regulatory protein-aspartic acid phosphatase [Romboutsia timonensis]MDY3002530.1 Spo0E family sporulation regulatory protein-aspartic acid phosphatase [Romboutsia timonensis]
MEELRNALNELYDRFGHNEVTVALSQILDRYIVEKQIEKRNKN